MFRKLLITSFTITAFSFSTQAATETLIVANERQYPPFSFLDEHGFAMGFDIDILKAIAENQDFKIEFVTKDTPELISGLEQGNYAIGVGGFSSGETGENLASSPYINTRDVIITQNNTREIKKLTDIHDLTVTAKSGTSFAEDLQEFFANDPSKINLQQTSFLAFRELAKGNVNAMLENREVSKYYAAQFPNLKIKIHNLSDDRYANYGLHILISKQQPNLTEKINMGLQQIIDNGSYQKIHQKWFHSDGELPK